MLMGEKIQEADNAGQPLAFPEFMFSLSVAEPAQGPGSSLSSSNVSDIPHV